MHSADTTIRNATGLHARPAAEFVARAKSFSSRVTIRVTGTDAVVNAKSIVMLLAGDFCHGTQVTVDADGPDEQEAVAALVTLIDSGFGES